MAKISHSLGLVLASAVIFCSASFASADHSTEGVEASHATTAVHAPTITAEQVAKTTSIDELEAILATLKAQVEALMAQAGGHSHGTGIEVGTQNAPTVDLSVTKDVVGGWNVHVETTNFAFAPELVNTTPVAGKGHAHLYVDGVKVARLYGPWYHLASPAVGTHTVRVELNANTHEPLLSGGKAIEDSVSVVEDRAPAAAATHH